MEATALVDLGITSDEFWRMTPRQFHAAMERRAYRDASFLAGYANLKRGKDDPFIKPEDFLARPQCKPGQLGPEVFHAFEKAFTDG
jgi:hypothetical protein